MARRLLAFALIGSMLGLLLAPATSVRACGPWFSTAIFTYSLHPDYPLADFAGGELGVLQPTYAPSYLLVAYRYLNGGKLTKEEMASVEKLWRARLQEANYAGAEESDATKRWLGARSRYAKTAGPKQIEVDRAAPSRKENDVEYSFINCLPDAFMTAAATLEQRAATFGAGSAALGTWIATQDAVFARCATPTADSVIPDAPALATDAPKLLVQDHAYQVASMNFYATEYDAATKGFAIVAADEASPWHGVAALMVARCLIRKATLIDGEAQRAVDLRAAQAALVSVARGSKDDGVRASARGLEGFVAFRLDPAARARELATEIAGPAPAADLGQAIDDYTTLDAKYTTVAGIGRGPAAGSAADLMDWVSTYGVFTDRATPAAGNHALVRWDATHSLAWLVAAMQVTAAVSDEAPRLIEAARGVDATSPAYVTVAFHRDRLLAGAGKRDEAREDVDAVLADKTRTLTAPARNLFLALRMQLATNLADWMKYAVRTPVLVVTTDAPEAWAPSAELGAGANGDASDAGSFGKAQANVALFDEDSAIAMTTRFPVATLAAASKSATLPEALRRVVTQGAWTRAVVLRDRAVAVELAPALKAAFPERAADIDGYVSAKTEDEQTFAGAFAILKMPGWAPLVPAGTGRDVDGDEKISSYHQNWWCAWEPPPGVKNTDYVGGTYKDEAKIEGSLEALYPEGAVASPEFLSAAEREAAAKEFAALAATGTAEDPLGDAVLAFAKAHPDDARVPEALHYVVRVTRYGCYGKTKFNYSKAAFELLHSKYPNSEWTKKTPYWF